MALLMSGFLTVVLTGMDSRFFSRWLEAFVLAWPAAFPIVFVVAPIARNLVSKIVD
jgi:hypothetical protein